MLKLLAPIALSLAACAAATTTTFDPETTPHHAARFEMSSRRIATAPAFPSAIEPRLPSVDRLAHVVRARLGSTAHAALDVCVSPEGSVASAVLARSSGLEAFDRALLDDASSWQFTTTPGPHGARRCRQVAIEYRTP